ALQHVVDHVTANEPDTVQYLVTVPVDNVSAVEIHIIGEYVSLPSAYDAQQALQSVRDLESLLQENGILPHCPEIHTGPVAIKTTSGPPLLLSSNPAIIPWA
ncbi:hypothetical protein BU25DRAFT_339522, partial [Macroventuria anomochaeta]